MRCYGRTKATVRFLHPHNFNSNRPPKMSPTTTNKTSGVRHEPAPNPVQYETSVYQNGLRYESPPFTFHSNQWEPQAAKAMSANSAGYAIGNAGSGETARKNVEAFGRWSIVPKRLVKSEELPDLGTKVLGEEFQFPIAAGPVGVLRELHVLEDRREERWLIYCRHLQSRRRSCCRSRMRREQCSLRDEHSCKHEHRRSRRSQRRRRKMVPALLAQERG